MAENDDLKGQKSSNLYNPGFPDLVPERGTQVIMDSDDISYESRQTLGDFLKDKTLKNKRPVPTGGSTPLPADSFIPSGETAGTFQNDLKVSDSNSLGNNSAGRFGNTRRGTVNKGESSPLSVYRDELEADGKNIDSIDIATVSPVKRAGNKDVYDVPPTPLQGKISDVLRYNRFNPDPNNTSFLEDGEFSKGLWSKQDTMGSYSPPEGVGVTVNDLKKMTQSILLQACGEFGINPDTVESVGTVSALLPSMNQMAISKVDTEDMRPMNNQPTTDGSTPMMTQIDAALLTQSDIDGGLLSSDSLQPTKSFGVLNSPDNPWGTPGTEGGTNVGMITVAATGYGVLSLATTIIDLITKTDISVMDESLSRNESHASSPHEMIKGNSRTGRGSVHKYKKLKMNIPDIDYGFDRCLAVGLSMFYGRRHNSAKAFDASMVTGFIQGLGNVSLHPGYFAVIHRMLVRDITSFSEDLTNFFAGKSPAELAIAMASGGFGTVLLGFFNTKVWLFMSKMAELGNAGLISQFGSTAFSPGKDIDGIPFTAKSRNQKSRIYSKTSLGTPLGYERGTLAWAHRTMPSRYLTSNNFKDARTTFSTVQAHDANMINKRSVSHDDNNTLTNTDLTALAEQWGDGNTTENNRLTSDYVKHIEKNLDSEYCPFYFHDLRTNEILAFHAFISSISDGFSVDYNKVGGYGRMDDVHIYSKTSRNISLTFTLAATSPEDHEVMWYNINKLVSMCYPQYSDGRTVAIGKDDLEQRFTVPFSQIQTASPLIRLRLGDLLKSNYSRFGLGRLFGLGKDENTFRVGDPVTLQSITDNREDIEEYNQAVISAQDTVRQHREQFQDDKNNITPGVPVKLTSEAKFYLRESTGSANKGIKLSGIYNSTAPRGPWEVEYNVDPTTSHSLVPHTLTDSGIYATPEEIDEMIEGGLGSNASNVVSRVTSTTDEVRQMSVENPSAGHKYMWDIEHTWTTTQTTHNRGYMILKPKGATAKWVNNELSSQSISANNVRILAYHSEVDDATDEYYAGLLQHYTNEIYEGAPIETLQTIDTALVGSISTNNEHTNDEVWNSQKNIQSFFDPDRNSVVRAFESTRGEGLAGVITQLDIANEESLWGTDQERNLRAPMVVQITIGFSPIHDLPIGLDSQGMMTSAPYGVGNIVRDRFGHPYEDGNQESTSDTSTTATVQPNETTVTTSGS